MFCKCSSRRTGNEDKSHNANESLLQRMTTCIYAQLSTSLLVRQKRERGMKFHTTDCGATYKNDWQSGGFVGFMSRCSHLAPIYMCFVVAFFVVFDNFARSTTASHDFTVIASVPAILIVTRSSVEKTIFVDPLHAPGEI